MNGGCPVVAVVRDTFDRESIKVFTVEGQYSLNGDRNDDLDLIEVEKWGSFKIDDKVMVSHGGGCWHKGYFAGVDEGSNKAMVFDNGMTSWSTEKLPSVWSFCRRPTKEEMK